MAVTDQLPAPYAPTSAIVEILNKYRNRGMQTPINTEVLARAGVSDSLISRTLQTLVTLDLLSDEGMPTGTFESLRTSPETEYKQCLQDWIKGVYSDVFSFVDPAEDDETSIRDAFRTYKPLGQQGRMVSLFVGLCEYAGLRAKKAPERKPRTSNPPKPQSKNTSNASVLRRKAKGSSGQNDVSLTLPSALDGLLKSLPEDGKGWTPAEHKSFVSTFNAVLNFCYPIIEASPDRKQEPVDNQEGETE